MSFINKLFPIKIKYKCRTSQFVGVRIGGTVVALKFVQK